MKKLYSFYILLILIGIVTISGTKSVDSNNGITGRTTSGCTCHTGTNSGSFHFAIYPSGGSNTDTNHYSGSATAKALKAGQAYTIDLTYNNTASCWGLDLKGSVGTLAVGTSTGLKLSGKELVHKSTIVASGSSHTFSGMKWTAPATVGPVTFNFAALAGNNDNSTSGDKMGIGLYTATIATVVAPVQFQWIKINVNENKLATITWLAANEKNILSYKVQQSFDGERFTDIAEVAYAASKNGLYTFTDVNTKNTTSYYRVKSTDAEGTTQYTSIVKYNPINIELNEFTVFPNPVTSKQAVKFNFIVSQEGKYNYTVYSVLGVKQTEQTIIAQKGINTGFINMPNLAQGLYHAVLTNNQGKIISKQLIQISK